MTLVSSKIQKKKVKEDPWFLIYDICTYIINDPDNDKSYLSLHDQKYSFIHWWNQGLLYL